jgi:pSer/pThr/pTyr-binding forkhead associated (FHA) protein
MAMRAQLQYLDGRSYRVVLLRDAITIGGRTSEIRLEGSTVTRQHARIFEEDGRYWIEDLGGDGVWVNGSKVERIKLTNRDQLQTGRLRLEYFEE